MSSSEEPSECGDRMSGQPNQSTMTTETCLRLCLCAMHLIIKAMALHCIRSRVVSDEKIIDTKQTMTDSVSPILQIIILCNARGCAREGWLHI